MQPTQNAPYAPTPDPYDFLNSPHKSGRIGGLLNTANLSTRGRLLLATIGLVILLIVVFALKSILTHPKVNLPSIYAVLGQEQELVNLATTGTQQAASQSYLNFSFTTVGSATTDQANLIKLLSANSIKISPKQYVLQPTADSALTQAEAVSDFDTTYSSVMQAELKLYETDLTNAYSLTKSSLLHAYLTQDYKNTELLLKMLGSSYG